MHTELSAALLARLARHIEAHTGLHFASARQADFERALGRMARARGGDLAQCAVWLLDGPWDEDKARECARHLTVAETYFFREPRAFDLVCDYARAKLAADPGASLRLWSAGCCTGEEPYSMAIALRRQVPELDIARVDILGSDINDASLDAARQAVYGRWSFRRSEPWLRADYFTDAGAGRAALLPEIATQVRFAQLNLAEPVYPSPLNGTAGMDIIFCRNVLMYFSRSQARRVIERLRACLVEGGWLVVNPSESSAELFSGFASVVYPDAVFYRKAERTAQSAACGRAVAPAPVPAVAQQALAHRRPAPLVAPAAAPLAAPVPAAADVGAPDDVSQALARAGSLSRAGQGEAALRALARAAEAHPLAGALYQAAAEIALERAEFGLALGQLKRLLYLDPDSVMAHYLAAVAHIRQGRARPALRQLDEAESLLASLADDAIVPASGGWQASGLRAALRVWREQAA
jgi:chemotaxis protein methyltransferase CheR